MKATLDQAAKVLQLMKHIPLAVLQVMFSTGILAEFLHAFKSPEQVARINRDEFRRVCEGREFSLVIDLDKVPLLPIGAVMAEYQLPGRVHGLWTWDPTRVDLILSRAQMEDGSSRGERVLAYISEDKTLGVNVLNWLIENPTHIPESWKGLGICFPGTIVRSHGLQYVHYMFWDKHSWRVDLHLVSDEWNNLFFSATLKDRAA